MAGNRVSNPLVVGLRDSIAPLRPAKGATAAAGPDDPATVKAFGVSPGGPNVRLFVGYFGGAIASPLKANEKWQVLFVDPLMSEWLLIPETAIKHEQRVEDPPGWVRDYVWVDSDAQMGRGDNSSSPGSIFLTGSFTRAGDFDAPQSGGTQSAVSGLLCLANSGFCCGSNSRRP